MAETFTNNLKLSKRDTGDLNWGQGANANSDLIDEHTQLKTLRPPRTLFASLGSGAVGANLVGNTTYFYKITAINEFGETTENKIPNVLEAQVTEPATPVPVILSWETVPGATGYKIYKSTTTNTELFLAQVSGGSTATYTDTGNTATQVGQTVPTTNTALLSVTSVRKLGEVTPLRGDVKLEAGANVTLTQDNAAGKITIGSAGGGVTSVRKEGEVSGLIGDVKLRAGANVALTQDGVGNAIEIASTGGGGVTSLRKFGEAAGLTGDVKIDQGADISLAQDALNNKIVVNYSGPKGYATVIAPAPTGTNDTANLQSALDAIPTGTGGRVILREGVYRVDSLLIQRWGTHLIGSGSGRDLGGENRGTQIRSTGFSSDMIRLQARNVLIENITFQCLQIPDGFAAIAGDPNIQVDRLEIHQCLFSDIRAPLDGIRIPIAFFMNITDCQFWMSEVAQQSVSRTPTAIKIGPTTFGFSLDEILITNCMFRVNYPAPTAGTITAKAIDLAKVKSAVIANCQALGINASANRIYIFAELKQDASIGSNAVVKGNSLTGFSQFIKQTGAFPKVAVGNNVFTQPGGTDPAIDLASGNTEWAITGNVIEGTTGINLQTGADNNVVQGNVANVVNSGAGNSLGGQSPFTSVVPAPTGVAITDTANIQNAINSVPASGGTVILKEGNYVVNQINLNKNGLRLIGTGNGITEDDTFVNGTRIQGNNAANPLVTLVGYNITVEHICFDGLNVPSGQPVMQIGDNITLFRFNLIEKCSFLNIKSGAIAGIRVQSIFDPHICDCYFLLKDAAAQTGVITTRAIQIITASRARISGCRFRCSYTAGVGGNVTAKCIDVDDLQDSIFSENHADVFGTSGTITFGFFESFTNLAGFKIVSNHTESLHFFIKVNSGYSNVNVVGNNHWHAGTGHAINLVTGIIRWVITGNWIGSVSPGVGINLQAGANNNIIVANFANIADAGTGNVIASNSFT